MQEDFPKMRFTATRERHDVRLRWVAFVIGRGRALSLVGLGFPAAEALLPIAVAAGILATSWRQTWVIAGLVVLVGLPGLLALLLRAAPTPGQTAGHSATAAAPLRRRDLLRSAQFALLLPAMLTTGSCQVQLARIVGRGSRAA